MINYRACNAAHLLDEPLVCETNGRVLMGAGHARELPVRGYGPLLQKFQLYSFT